jgi:hypothetical protein
MGGLGSGGKNKAHDYTSRYKTLDSFMFGECIPIMEKAGMAEHEGPLRCHDGTSVNVVLYPDCLVVEVDYCWAHKGERGEIYEDIRLDTVGNNYGGQRYYFLCPCCGRRCRFLYLHQVHFKCRQCAQLNYTSQQVTHGPDEAAHRLNQFLRNKFGVGESLAPFEFRSFWPERLHGMHYKTYERLLQEYDDLYAQYDRAFVAHACLMFPDLMERLWQQKQGYSDPYERP